MDPVEKGYSLKVLLYANSTERSRLVLPWVRHLAENFGAEVTIQTTRGAGPGEARAAAIFQRELGGERLNLRATTAGADSPERAIVSEATECDADLVIMAPAGRRGIRRLMRGSMVGNVVKRIDRSALIVRGGVVPPRSILVCVSGSRHSLTNVRVASRLAVSFGARLTIMMVLSQIPLQVAGETEELRTSDFLQSDHSLAAHLRTAEDLMRSLGAEGGVRVAHGLVVEEILEEMETFDHDLLVIGTHQAEDYDPLYEDLTSELIRRCDRTTFVVGTRADPL